MEAIHPVQLHVPYAGAAHIWSQSRMRAEHHVTAVA